MSDMQADIVRAKELANSKDGDISSLKTMLAQVCLTCRNMNAIFIHNHQGQSEVIELQNQLARLKQETMLLTRELQQCAERDMRKEQLLALQKSKEDRFAAQMETSRQVDAIGILPLLSWKMCPDSKN